MASERKGYNLLISCISLFEGKKLYTEKLIVTHLIKTFLVPHGTSMFITLFMIAYPGGPMLYSAAKKICSLC